MSAFYIFYENGVKKMRPILSPKEYLLMRNTSRQLEIINAVRNGDSSRKRELLQCNYSCLPNPDGTLKGSKVMSNSVGMDIDHIAPEKVEEVKQRILALKDEIGLLMCEKSARGEGFHIVFKRNSVLTQEGNLRAVADLLGVEYDANAKDITRVFFTTTANEDDLIFLSPELFNNSTCEVQDVAEEVKEQPKREDAEPSAPTEQPVTRYEDYYDGVSYSAIVTELENQLGGVPAHGSRNNFIFTMACHLRYICDDNPNWIKQVLPTYGEDEDKAFATIKSACNRSQNKQMPQVLQMALTLAKNASKVVLNGEERSNTPPPMPDKLPPLVELLVSRTPDIYKPAVAHAIFPALATHLYNTTFRYIDNVEHEATLMCCLMAGTGAGKNCTAEPIRYIMQDINERDAISRERERAWKEDTNTKGASKDKQKRPEGIIIQNVKPDMTNAAFVQRMHEAEGRFLYTQMNEIDQFDALKTSAKSKSQFQIMCLAFDPGNTYGTERVGTASVSETVCVRFNWNASTTIQKGKKYFANVLTDGPISRINFCTIPEREIGSDMPIYGTYGESFVNDLKPYIDRLNSAYGLIECPQAFEFARTLNAENRKQAELSQNRTFENLSFRANVIAYLKAMVLFIAHGFTWDERIADFIRWSEEYDLWCKMEFFGEAIERASDEPTTKKMYSNNLLAQLPNEFTQADMVAILRKNEAKSPVHKVLRNWVKRGYIAQIEKSDSYSKL